jgi:hypothetical protein
MQTHLARLDIDSLIGQLSSQSLKKVAATSHFFEYEYDLPTSKNPPFLLTDIGYPTSARSAMILHIYNWRLG